VPIGEERCNALDDDCDGRVDEEITPIECGPEDCRTVVHCEAGTIAECVPRIPTVESCNVEDDDCDGVIDEGLAFGPLGDVVTLRTDEFDTGPCSTCSWAFGPALAPTADGLMAFWTLGLYGGDEEPNLYGRRLDRRGRPNGPIELMREDFFLTTDPMAALEPFPALGVPLEAYYRVGRQDVYGILFLGPTGETRAVQPLAPFGSRNIRKMVWTGERLIGAWSEGGLRLVSYAGDGTDERPYTIAGTPDSVAAVTLGVYPGRVGILLSVNPADGERYQWLVVLNPRGDLLSSRRVDMPYANWQRLVGVHDGWMYMSPGSRRTPSTWQLLSVEGEPRTELGPFADGRVMSDSGASDIFIPRPAQRETLVVWSSPFELPDAEMHVEFRDAEWAITRSWSGRLPEEPEGGIAFLGDPHVSLDGDHMVVIWHAGSQNPQPNRVYALELGCMP
jgi:hypothetical protein